MRSFSMRQMVLACILALLVSAVLVRLLVSHNHPQPGSAPAMVHRLKDGSVDVTPGSPLAARLKTRAVTIETEPHGLRVPATVRAEPERAHILTAPVAGRITDVLVRPGQTVKRGDILAQILSGDYAQAQADLKKANAQRAFAEKAVHRAQGVLAIGGNAQKDLDAARNDLAQARAEADRARDRLRALSSTADNDATLQPPSDTATTSDPDADNGQIALRSPVDGVLASTTLAAGTYINDLTVPLATVLDLSEVWIEAAIPQNTLEAVHVGQAATAHFALDSRTGCSAPITSIDPALDMDTRRMSARLVCINPDLRLLPNMFGQVTITIPQPSDVMVPKSALLMNDDAITVFVETAPHIFRRRAVTVSYDEGSDVRVLTGLNAGDRVVTHGGILINDE